MNFNPVLLIDVYISTDDNALWWTPRDFTDDDLHWFRLWHGAVKQQIRTWSNVDRSISTASYGITGNRELKYDIPPK